LGQQALGSSNILYQQINRVAKELGVPATIADFALPSIPLPQNWQQFKAYHKQAIPIAQHAVRNIQPVGPAASAALGVLGQVIEGGSLEEIAWAAVEGAMPSGLNMAVNAARSAMRGQPPIQIALDVAAGYFEGTPLAPAASLARSYVANGRLSAQDIAQGAMSLAGGAGFSAEDMARAALGQGTLPGYAQPFQDIMNTVNTVRSGAKSPMDVAAGFALAYFKPDSPAALGAETAIQILRSGNPTAAALSAARANMPPEFQAGLDTVVGTIGRRGFGIPIGRPTPNAAVSSTIAPPVIQFTGDPWPSSVIAQAYPAMVSSAGLVSSLAPPKQIPTTANVNQILTASASPAVPPPVRTTASATPIPVVTTTARPPMLFGQPRITQGSGALVANDRSIKKGFFRVASGASPTGIPGILVLTDGKLVRELFSG
jgi:hypothetical protein